MVSTSQIEPKTRLACIGECMIELSELNRSDGLVTMGIAGDTLNSATYLARLLPTNQFSVSYLTRLGQDPLSDRILNHIRSEEIDTTLIGRDVRRNPGIYAINVNAQGERSFVYWRSQSAARELFSTHGPTLDDLATFDVIFLSAITLAILPQKARDGLIAACRSAKNDGRTVVFDSNYRSTLWENADIARENIMQMWSTTSISLPSYDDELILHPGETPKETILRIAALGAQEIALKNAAAGPLLWPTTKQANFAPASHVVDTTGAGDAFNAGYLAARLKGDHRAAAASAGHELAKLVIAKPGAILPRSL